MLIPLCIHFQQSFRQSNLYLNLKIKILYNLNVPCVEILVRILPIFYFNFLWLHEKNTIDFWIFLLYNEKKRSGGKFMAETDFGHVGDMTKSDFKVAIDYFKSKLNKIQNDNSINKKTKAFFVRRYNKRINELTKSYQRLSEMIGKKRSAGDYVNENKTTLSSLHMNSGKDSFRNLYSSSGAYGIAQALKIVGAVVFPIVGTIPLIKSFLRSRKRRKMLRNENIDMRDFVARQERTYDENLLSDKELTNDEIMHILDKKGEVDRLQDILDNASTNGLNPFQIKNLSAKLKKIREFAQKNGYESDVRYTLPDETKYQTDIDKFNESVKLLDTEEEGIHIEGAASENLVDAHKKYQQITNIKQRAEELLGKIPKDASKTELESLIARLDVQLILHKANATKFVENSANLAMFENRITVAKTTLGDKTALETSNTALDTAVYTTKVDGVTLTDAISYATQMEISTEKLDSLFQLYTENKQNNQTKLDALKTEEENKTKVSDAAVRLDQINKLLDSLSGTLAIKKVNLQNPVMKKEIDKLIAEAESLIGSVDGLDKTVGNFAGKETDFKIRLKTEYDKIMAEIGKEEQVGPIKNLLDAYASKISLLQTKVGDPTILETTTANLETQIKTILGELDGTVSTQILPISEMEIDVSGAKKKISKYYEELYSSASEVLRKIETEINRKAETTSKDEEYNKMLSEIKDLIKEYGDKGSEYKALSSMKEMEKAIGDVQLEIEKLYKDVEIDDKKFTPSQTTNIKNEISRLRGILTKLEEILQNKISEKKTAKVRS